MRWWIALRFRLRAWSRPDSLRSEIDEELEYHVQVRTEELRREGMPTVEARQAALEAFGDLQRIRERCREEYMLRGNEGGEGMRELLQDVRHAVRSVTRHPGFAAAVVLTLGVGIGANSAIFTVLDGVLLQPLPYHEPGKLVRLWQADRVNDTRFENLSAPDFYDVAERNEVFSGQAALEYRTVTLVDAEDQPARLMAVAASHQLADLLGLPPTLGRWFLPGEDLPDGGNAAVLGHGLWTTRYGADPAILGRTIRLEGEPFEIVGVAHPDLELPQPDVPLWIPLHVGPSTRSRGQHNFPVVARLAEGVSLEQADANLAAIAAALEVEAPDENNGRAMWAQPLRDSIVGDVSTALYLLSGAVGLVLLIACVNVANLLLVHSNSQGRDLAVQLAMGADRPRLVRRLLTEYAVLGGLGGVAGLALAFWGVRTLVAMGPASLPRLDNVAVDGTVLALTLVVSLGTGLVCGLLPSLQASRTDLRDMLTDGGRGAPSGRAEGWLRNALVVTEVAMAVMLASGAGLLIESLANLRGVDPGFDPEGVVSAAVQLPPSRYPQERVDWPEYPEVLAFQRELAERVRGLPGVTDVAMALNLPTSPGWTTRFSISGAATAAYDPTAEVRIRVITSSYPETVGMELVRGRLPDARDDLYESPPVALINEAFAERYFPESEPLGAMVDNWGTPREIVGVVRDVRFMGLSEPVEPAVYPMFARMPFSGFSIIVRTGGDPAPLGAALRGVVAEIDPDLAIGTISSLEESLDASTGQARFNGLLLTIFAAVSLILATVGIYGVVSYGVTQRTHEIGVRLSLGASAASVAREVVRDVLRLTGMGVALGLLGVGATSRLLSGLLYQVEPFDVVNTLTVVAVCAGAALLAAYAPARRASRVDPVRAVTGNV